MIKKCLSKHMWCSTIMSAFIFICCEQGYCAVGNAQYRYTPPTDRYGDLRNEVIPKYEKKLQERTKLRERALALNAQLESIEEKMDVLKNIEAPDMAETMQEISDAKAGLEAELKRLKSSLQITENQRDKLKRKLESQSKVRRFWNWLRGNAQQRREKKQEELQKLETELKNIKYELEDLKPAEQLLRTHTYYQGYMGKTPEQRAAELNQLQKESADKSKEYQDIYSNRKNVKRLQESNIYDLKNRLDEAKHYANMPQQQYEQEQLRYHKDPQKIANAQADYDRKKQNKALRNPVSTAQSPQSAPANQRSSRPLPAIPTAQATSGTRPAIPPRPAGLKPVSRAAS